MIGMIRCGGRRFKLEYHYLGDPETRKSEFVCMTILDAINLTLESENWRPIVFDEFIEEDSGDVFDTFTEEEE